MKSLAHTYLLIFGLLASFSLQAQSGIKFFHGTWEEALALAKKEHKNIFMDAYAEWCGPCKRMAKDVFTQKEVGDFYNKHFINVKMDMEKGEGPKLSGKYRVSAYPTLLFIDGEGELVNSNTGALPSDRLIALGKATLAKADKSKDLEEEYENGNRDPEFLRAYAYALMVSSKPTLKIANEYLKTQDNLENTEVLEFIYDFATEADCSIFDKMVKYREQLIGIKGEDIFKAHAQKACEATVQKAIEFNTPELVEEAKKQMKAAMPDFAAEYSLLADIQYAFDKGDLDNLIKSSDKYLKKFAKGNAEKYYYHAALLSEFRDKTDAWLKAEKWAEEAYKLSNEAKHGLLYARLMQLNGKKQEGYQLEQKIKSLEAH